MAFVSGQSETENLSCLLFPCLCIKPGGYKRIGLSFWKYQAGCHADSVLTIPRSWSGVWLVGLAPFREQKCVCLKILYSAPIHTL